MQCLFLSFSNKLGYDDRVDELYSILDLMLLQTRASAAIPILGGDFNACIGAALPQDDVALLGFWGLGARHDRRSKLARWVFEHQFNIGSRFAAKSPMQDSWTCRRAFDNSCVQADFIICDLRLTPSPTWHDFSTATGVDHRCVHSLVELVVSKPLCQKGRRKGKDFEDGSLFWMTHNKQVDIIRNLYF